METLNYKTEIEKNGVITFVPTGNSMLPFIKNHKYTVIAVKKTERLKPLDVALYTVGDKYVLHRVLAVKEGYYIICGDNRPEYEKVNEDDVFGVITGYYKGKKYVDCNDPAYIKKIKKWYKNEKTRKRKIKRIYRNISIKHKFKRLFEILTGKK